MKYLTVLPDLTYPIEAPNLLAFGFFKQLPENIRNLIIQLKPPGLSNPADLKFIFLAEVIYCNHENFWYKSLLNNAFVTEFQLSNGRLIIEQGLPTEIKCG